MAKKQKSSNTAKFRLEFQTDAQKYSWNAFQEKDILFLIGPAGTGKTHLATAFAINEILKAQKNRIVMTRPIVEAGESLGYLPGEFHEKVAPYMMPLYDSLTKIVGAEGPQREMVNAAVEIAPIAYLRGRTFDDSVCILDEAQNCTVGQLKLFLTRLGRNSKMIITGDPSQTDIGDDSGLMRVVDRLRSVPEIGIVTFDEIHIVRHPLVAAVLKALA